MAWAVKQYAGGDRKYGAGSVKISKTAVRIVLDDDPDSVYEFSLKDAPENAKAGHWWIGMSADGERLWSISPINSAAKLAFEGFSKTEGQLPAPKHIVKEGTDPKTGSPYKSEYDQFTALFKIVGSDDPDEVGMIVTYTLRYYFFNNDGQVGLDKPRSKYTVQLADFLDASGATQTEMNYSENILPALERRILEAGRLYNAIIKEGRIDSLSPILHKPGKKQEEPEGDE